MKIKATFLSCVLFSLALGCTSSGNEMSKVEDGFRQVPDSIRLAAYWYWVSDNLSVEGVIKDLHAMKKAGITRAYIGNIKDGGIAPGTVKLFSPEWWEVTHAALKTATELDIEIGIFNSPGWSQSGGPWVKPEESMRYLALAETEVLGPGEKIIQLPTVGEDAQDVRIIAYPSFTQTAYEKSWELVKEHGKTLTRDLKLDKETVIRNVTVKMNDRIRTNATLYVKEGNEYRPVKEMYIERSNPALNVGFIPYAPVSFTIPETKASEFRLVFGEGGGGKIEVVLSEKPQIEMYAEKSLAKMFPEPLPLWDSYKWAVQPESSSGSWTIDPASVIDLTAKVNKAGELNWNVPEGKWTVVRSAMLTTGVTNAPAPDGGTGLEIDKMSRKHIATHFDAFIGEILRRIPAEDRKTFTTVVADSYETGGQTWTDDMAEVFEQRYGYNPIPFLPVFKGEVVGSQNLSDRFLWDLRRLIADRVAYDYVGGLREVCHQHGLTSWLENYGHWGFPGEFLQYGGQSDEIAGEFWSEGSLGDIENRAASSCGHIYGKNRIWAESCTSGSAPFSNYPYRMKQRVDRFFTEGINATLLHLYIHQPYDDKDPGVSAWFGNEFNRKNTWFTQMDIFADYLRRCNFMLQQGRYVADVAYFIGEDAPAMTGICDPALPNGYSFDYINGEILMEQSGVKNGKLVLDSGMEYSVLVLPKLDTMRPELLAKIKDMVNDGLVLLGPAPYSSPSFQNYPSADEKVSSLATELWGTNQKVNLVGKGRVYKDGTSLEDIFKEIGVVADFALSAQDAPALFIHRTLPDGEMYFISNPSEEQIRITPTFRVSGKAPELWNPQNVDIRFLPEYRAVAGGTEVPLTLEPLESAFIVFRQSGKGGSSANFMDKEVVETLSGPWTVAFDPGKRGPKDPIVFNTLQDWSTHPDLTVQQYSGSAVYTTTFTLPQKSNQAYYLDLGNVMVMARVTLNGKEVGGVWTLPYRLNITDYLNVGENKLEIEVVNNWRNRLIGDQMLPEEERPTWTTHNPWKKDSPLQSSGLLGPVEIQAYDYSFVRR